MTSGGHTALQEQGLRWLSDRLERGELRANSMKVEAGRLRSFIGLHPDLEPSEIERRHLLEWQGAIGQLAPATRRTYIGTVGRFLTWLHREGLLEEDLRGHLGKVKEPRRAPRALPQRDVTRILDCCPVVERRYRTAVWLRPATALMVGCGLRCVEVSRLDLDDYDPIGQTLFVRGKGDHERQLPVPKFAAVALAEYLLWRGPLPGPLFRAVGSKAAPSGRLSAKWISKRTGRVMRDAGVHRVSGDRKTAHALRHTAATDVLRNCHDVRLVQQMLGHASLATTMIYLGWADEQELRSAMEGRDYQAC